MARSGSYKDRVRSIRVTDGLSIQVVEITKRRLAGFARCSYCGEGDYWNESWPAGLALSKYLATRFPRERLNGCRALVVGCGVGLEGLVLARLGATVSFLDHVTHALQLVHKNCLLNDIGSFETVRCCWRDSEEVRKLRKYDLLVGSDVLYNRADMIWIKHLLTTSLDKSGIALFADPVRSHVMAFFRLLVKSDFRVKWNWVDASRGSKKQRIRIYWVERSEGQNSGSKFRGHHT